MTSKRTPETDPWPEYLSDEHARGLHETRESGCPECKATPLNRAELYKLMAKVALDLTRIREGIDVLSQGAAETSQALRGAVIDATGLTVSLVDKCPVRDLLEILGDEEQDHPGRTEDELEAADCDPSLPEGYPDDPDAESAS